MVGLSAGRRDAFGELSDELAEHLLGHVMPFWTSHALDAERGGIFTFIADDGTIRSRAKSIVSNTRALWTFSALAHRIEDRPSFRQAADGIYSFLSRCGRDEDGLWVYVVDEEGGVLVGEKSIVTDAFAIDGLTEYFRLTGSPHALEIALETARLARARLARPGTYNTAPYPTPPGMRAHREIMQFSLAFCELGDAAGDTELLHEGLALAREVLTVFWKPELGVLLEYVGPNGELADTPEGRTMVPGHAIESLWFQMRNLARYAPNEVGMLREAARAVKPCLERGWDPEHGGILLGVDIAGTEPVYWPNADMKRWWPETEALPALLLAYEQLGERWCLSWFDRVLEWAVSHFPDPAHGEWIQNLARDGTPLPPPEETPRGAKDPHTHGAPDEWRAYDLAVKDPFHLPRGLIVSIETLVRLAEQHHG